MKNNKKYTIIADSTCDLKKIDLTSDKFDFETTPLTIEVGGVEYVDDESLDTKELLVKMKHTKQASKTACPNPEAFTAQMRAGNDLIFCITLSSKLSATYQSACLAAETVHAEQPNKKIFILDSLTASSGMARILYKLIDLINDDKYNFEEITEKLTEIRNKSKIRFLLNDLSNLAKSGRMGKIASIITSIIPLKLLCGDNGAGEIKQYKKVLGFNKALESIAEFPGESLESEGIENPIFISHCNNQESANFLKKLLESKFGFNNIKTLIMRGVTTLIANDKGLAIAY